jgi:pimeloyl-ACP methyl ester carboxylesterase
MFEKLRANLIFHKLLKRPDISKAYKMVSPTDSWYDTITTVHNSLAKIRQLSNEILQITSHDGLKLQAVYYPCEGSMKTMIWIHGYTSHAERESAFPSLFYRGLGFNVLIPYLRAHGPSEGKYISFGALEYLDIIRWVDEVNERIPDGEIVIHGLSMGGGIALDLATQEMKNVKALVVDAPSYSIEGFFRGVAEHVSRKNRDMIFACLCNRFRDEFDADPCAFNRVDNIKKGRYPLLLLAGSMEDMEEVLDQLKQNNPKPTNVLILPGCNHGNGMYKQTEMYQGTIKAFFEEHLHV